MAATVRVYVEDVATKIATYTTIRLYRDTTPGGAFATLAGSATLVAGQEEYEIEDSGGSAGSYYQYTFYHATGPVESDPSEIFRPDACTLLSIMAEAARQADAGFQSTCTSTGTATSLVDVTLLDQGGDAKFCEGLWIYRPDAAVAGDKVRRIASDGFDTSAGAFQPSRAWSNAPAEDEVYYVFAYLPPIDQSGIGGSWARCVRDAMYNTFYQDEVNLGEGTTAAQTRFSLQTHDPPRTFIRRVKLRTVDSNDVYDEIDAATNGRWWTTIHDGPSTITLDIHPAPLTSETVIVELDRPFAPLYNDSDITECPLDLAWRGTLWALFSRLNKMQPGKYKAEEAMALAEWQGSRGRDLAPPVVVGL